MAFEYIQHTISKNRSKTSSAVKKPSLNPMPQTLEQCVRSRHSTRFFKPDPVPLNILQECLKLAQLAPSNSNIQNWRLKIAIGPARDRIVESLKVEHLIAYVYQERADPSL
jgi:nitroreductase